MSTAPTLLDTEQPGRVGPRRWGWLAAGIWLFYLGTPLHAMIRTGHGPFLVIGIVALVLFGLSYLAFFTWIRGAGVLGPRSSWQRLAYVAGMLGLGGLMVPAAGQTALSTLVYVTAIAMMSIPLRIAVPLVVVLLVVAELSVRLVPGWSDTSYGLAVFLAALATFGMSRAIQRQAELAAARKDMAELAVQEERNRFARDLHDILGHSLTVITVKAELAGRLIQANPDRAASEVAEVEQLARAALADVRAAVAGYREVSLAGELVRARAVLQAAGIRAELPTTVDVVPEGNRELFAWVVREGVTNVVKHSAAKRCTIRLGERRIEVLDDGTGPAAAQADGGKEADGTGGHGLVGLRERADAVGATVEVGTAPGGGYRLAVRVGP